MVGQVLRGSRKLGGVWILILAALSSGVARAAVAAPEEGRKLSLAECLRMALSNNLDLVSARKDPAIAEQGVLIQDASFDPALTSEISHSTYSADTRTGVFGLNQSDTDQASVGLAQDLKFGASYSVALVAEKQRQELQQGAALVTDDTASANLALDFRLPLLGNPATGPAGREATTEVLEQAQRDWDISREQLRIEAHRTLEQVEGAYWDVVAGREALRIAGLSLGRAEDLLGLNRKKVEVGTLAPIEITQAQAGVAGQEEGVILAETNLGNAEDELRRLLAVPHDDPLWDEHLLPVDQPVFAERQADLDADIRSALDHRPEMEVLRQQLRKDELSERVARRKVRPGLVLSAGLTPIGVDTEVGAALGNVPDFDSYSWNAALNLTYPLGNHAAKAGYAISTLNREKSQVGLLNQEQTVRVDVRRAVRGVESAAKRVQAAGENVRLQTEKLHAEEKKFENGLSTSFEVLTFQNDLADAELSQVRATLDYAKALTALERAKGTLLEARGLTLAP